LFPGLPQFQIMLEHTEVAERGLIDWPSKYCLKLLLINPLNIVSSCYACL
jgi:hypothetical protein